MLERELGCLREQGFTDILLMVSHMVDKITAYFGVYVQHYHERCLKQRGEK